MLRGSLRAAGCPACRPAAWVRVLNASSFANSQPATRSTSQRHRNEALRPHLRQSFSSTVRSLSDDDARPQQDVESRPAEEAQRVDNNEEAEPARDESSKPWYLEVEPPLHPTLSPQQAPLPDIPPDSPRLVEPLVKFVADDLGIDDLNLMDLRALDPPPVLGPQLIMLFGTARSERHLHVSADRLVRWLRRYGVSATADGLLGRNELKIKLRRKARKAKLMGNSGLPSSEDDGITTRWICVNLGTIGWSSQETELVDADGKVTGFGSAQTGTTIVVQLLTEARRQELDLETLWSRMLARSEAKTASFATAQATPEAEVDKAGAETVKAIGGFGASSKARESRRYFSTSVERTATMQEAPSRFGDSLPPGRFDVAELSRRMAQDGHLRNDVLRRLEFYIPDISLEQSSGAFDELVELCNFATQGLPASETWGIRASLYATGISASRPGHTLDGLTGLLDEMKLSGIPTNRIQSMHILRAIFATSPEADGEEVEGAIAEVQTHVAMDLIETMFERGESIMANDVIINLVSSLAASTIYSPAQERLQTFMESLMKQAKLPCPEEKLLIQLMDAYAARGDWDKYWDTWHIPARYSLPRSEAMYLYMYRKIAATGHQSRCIDAVRRCFDEMLSEDPPIRPRGAMLNALYDCIRVADPAAFRIVEEIGGLDVTREKVSSREFVSLLRKLQAMQG